MKVNGHRKIENGRTRLIDLIIYCVHSIYLIIFMIIIESNDQSLTNLSSESEMG